MIIDGRAEGDVKQGAIGITWFLGKIIHKVTRLFIVYVQVH